MSARQRYLVVTEEASADAALVCEAVFAVLDDSARAASVDAYSDIADSLPSHQVPADIRAAEQWLRGQGFRRDDGDPGASVRLRRDDDVAWTMARSYAPWSVHVVLYDADDAVIATIDDGGHTAIAALTADEATLLAALVSPDHRLEPLEPTGAAMPVSGENELERTLETWASLRS